jgi:hypothetical protein
MFVPSGGTLGFFGGALGLYSRVVLGILRVLGCFGFWFWAPLYTFCVPRGIDGLGSFVCLWRFALSLCT